MWRKYDDLLKQEFYLGGKMMDFNYDNSKISDDMIKTINRLFSIVARERNLCYKDEIIRETIKVIKSMGKVIQ